MLCAGVIYLLIGTFKPQASVARPRFVCAVFAIVMPPVFHSAAEYGETRMAHGHGAASDEARFRRDEFAASE